jgi:hypothetical protein
MPVPPSHFETPAFCRHREREPLWRIVTTAKCAGFPSAFPGVVASRLAECGPGGSKGERNHDGWRNAMQRTVVEFGGIPVGIAVAEGDLLRFIAVKFHVIDLDEQRFTSMSELRRAISQHLSRAASLAA